MIVISVLSDFSLFFRPYIWSEGWIALKTTNKVPLPGCFKKREKEIVGWGHWMQVFDW